MPVPLLHRRMASAARLALIPGDGELIFDTSVAKPFMGDGITSGGIPADGAYVTGNNTTSYSLLDTDVGKLIVFTASSGPIALALAQAASSSGLYFPDGSFVTISNQSPSQGVTITATTSTISGASTLVLHPGDSAKIISDGTNYWALVSRVAFISPPIVTKTANYSVLAGDSGAQFNNIGASGTVIFTLPVSAIGLGYSFLVDAAQTLEISVHSGGDVIGWIGSTAPTLSINTPYSFVTLSCQKSGIWVVTSMVGNWNLI